MQQQLEQLVHQLCEHQEIQKLGDIQQVKEAFMSLVADQQLEDDKLIHLFTAIQLTLLSEA